MSDIEKFKQMDEEEIFKRTYIAPKNVKCLKEENFKELGSKSRAVGFISILERQLGLDLSELRQKAEEYFANHQEEHHSGFHIPEGMGERKKAPLLKILIFLIIAAGAYYLYFVETKKGRKTAPLQQDFFSSKAVSSSSSSVLSSSSSSVISSNIAMSEESSAIVAVVQKEEEQSSSSSLVAEINGTQEQNATVAAKEQSSSSSSQMADVTNVVIVPKQKVWVGIIYLDNYQKKQLLTAAPIELNTSRDQLVVTGHGKLQIDINGEMKDLDTVKKQRFIYQNGKFEVIDRKTFKLYNRGRDW